MNPEELVALLPPSWKATVAEWIREDIPSFDYGGYVVGCQPDEAILFGKSKGVLAGRPFFDEIFHQLGCRVEWFLDEGTYFEPVKRVARVTGPVNSILVGERPALNTLARASGIATRARAIRQKKDACKWHGLVAATRKTTPGFRLVEKYGVLVGGLDMHRMDLSSMIMLKDNHIWAQGSIAKAVEKARAVGGFALKIEVEARTEAEAEEAIQAKADVIMLDNMDADKMKVVAASLKKRHPHVLLEGSGGITEEDIETFFSPAIDILSLGSLTQSVPHVDFSLKIQGKNSKM